jgi:stearoyl-CoA desaturase (delta-9 desaturase)
MLNGIYHLSWLGCFGVAFVLTHITALCITVFLHRSQSHRALDVHPLLSHFFRFWLWLTTGMNTKAWVAIHRKHHARCETDEDPHSPQIFGLSTVLWQGVELYRRESVVQATLDQYGQGTPDDWIEHHLYSKYSTTGIVLMLVIDCVLFGFLGLSVWALQMMWAPFCAAGIINGVGHYWGYRNFECKDASKNVLPFGFLIAGEELHNNHHAYGSSAKFSVKPWEFDIGWMYIRLFAALRLVTVKRTFPVLQHDYAKQHIDINTIKALVINRLQVMAEYRQQVLTPMFQLEKQKAADCFKRLFSTRMRALLGRERTLVTPEEQARLNLLLQENIQLKTVYHFREQLQSIWERTTATQKELLDAVQDWCWRAQESQIEHLVQFAMRIRYFTV